MTINLSNLIDNRDKSQRSVCDGLLTTDHSRSSYGMPVLVVGGTAYGPADWPRTIGIPPLPAKLQDGQVDLTERWNDAVCAYLDSLSYEQIRSL